MGFIIVFIILRKYGRVRRRNRVGLGDEDRLDMLRLRCLRIGRLGYLVDSWVNRFEVLEEG